MRTFTRSTLLKSFDLLRRSASTAIIILRWILHAQVEIPIQPVPPILWEGRLFPGTSLQRKRCDKNEDLCASIHCSGENIIVFDEKGWSIVAQVPLTEEADEKEHAGRGIYAYTEPTDEIHQDSRVPVVEAELGKKFVAEPERDGAEEA
jgi:hypothetical protein